MSLKAIMKMILQGDYSKTLHCLLCSITMNHVVTTTWHMYAF